MFKKVFLSIVFAHSKIQILKLDGKKQSIAKHTSVPIPEGLIVNHKIMHPQQLITLLKDALKKNGYKEKFAAIVVPEFSTYSKLLSLPKLKDKELDEAIVWQSQDFLPSKADEMIMDWRIVEERSDHFQVLATAIRKDILADYVNVVNKAGLLPLVVETPSISLNRLSVKDSETNLLIYVSPEETILTVSQGKRILGSSVANSSSQNEIVATARRMANYYSNLQIKRITLGGSGLSKEFVDLLGQQLQLPIEQMSVNVKAASEEIKQEFLIPISLQFKDPARPADSTTINLLPPDWVAHYQKQLKGLQTWTLTLVCSIIIWAIFISVVIYYMLMATRLQNLQDQSSSVSQVASSEVVTEVNRVNALTKKIIDYYDKLKYPQEYINEIAAIKPDGVTIETYDLNFENGVFVITGKSINRSLLSRFRDSLDENEKYTQVSLPNTYLVQDQDNVFKIEFLYSQTQPKQVPKLKLQ